MKTIKGNLIDLAETGAFDIIVQGCNCFNTMGGGIAREIKQRCPQAWEADCDTSSGDINKLGTYTQGWNNGGTYRIINAYTQYNMSGGEDVFEYASFEVILRKLAHVYGVCQFGLPMIGMGLARGDKERIMRLLEKFDEAVTARGGTVTLVEFEK